jgi:hypothetical protein
MCTWQRSEVHIKFLPENLVERNHWEEFGIDEQDVNIWTAVKWFKIGLCEHMDCSQMVQGRIV